ncbi:MAG: mannose-1-phosphate guanylyltransferase/mannose-6-phosphate isomerase [Limnohabitans sp.]
MIAVTPVILCGGSGTRLWPLSRTGFPKQFLCLTGQESLFQMAAKRLMNLADEENTNEAIQVDRPLLVAGEDHRFLAAEQLREVGIELGTALLEPIGRNTAPALTLAALAAMQSGRDPLLVVTPADQTVSDETAFIQAMRQAIVAASAAPKNPQAAGTIVILGIEPTSAETGYGYIQADALNPCEDNAQAVMRFVEKPDPSTAQEYLQAGGYYWNAGMFVLKASVWLKALEKFRPDILQATHAAWNARTADERLSTHFIRPDKQLFAAVPSESIDYAVMEKCAGTEYETRMVPLNAGWSDLGAWDAVWKALAKDPQDNALHGDVMVSSSQGNLVHASSRLVSLVGVQGLMVVETSDAVLVANKSLSQDVKHIVAELQRQGRQEHSEHRKVHRPWGWYDSIDEGDRFKVKRILVTPGASLSLQKHHHRAEHWVVVKGTAEVTVGDQVITLSENQSTYIPLGQAHRLANPGKVPLEIIEVQSGSYLGEDDIVRLEDTYGRA